MIEVRNLYKSFGQTTVLNDINFEFEPGKCNLVIGASGSGKTTLAKCIVGLHEIDKGQIIYDGQEFSGMTDKERLAIRKSLGFLFQGAALFDSMTVQENIKFPLTMFSDMSEEEQLDRVNFCLARVNLENKNHLFPSELSGGMKKRVGIARSISMQPKYLFCDEPNSGLDPQTSIVIDNLIHDITEEYNITTVVITHDMNSVLEIGDKVAFLFKGELYWQGSKDVIMGADKEELVKFVYASRYISELKGI